MSPGPSGPQLHLLRPYTEWRVKEYSTRAAIEYVRDRVPAGHLFGTLTARYPTRWEELKGGSVYWAKRGNVLFRMPLRAIEASGASWWILMDPEVIPVRPARVGCVRGWRYLRGDRAPADDPDLRQILLSEIEAAA